MREIIKKNRSAFLYNKEKIREFNSLCSPLTDLFDVSFVGYLKLFDDSSYLALSNNLKWQRHFMQNVHNNGINFQKAVESTPLEGTFKFIWPCRQNDGTFERLYHHNIWNAMSIYRRGAT